MRELPPVDHGVEARLWNPDFRRFFIARTTSLLGDQMLPIAITAALVHTRHGMSGVGYALAAHIAPFAVLLIFGGVLSDRFGARRLMIVSDAARLVCQAALALLLMLGEPELWQMLILLALLGAGGATFQPGVASMIPRLAKDVQRGNAVLRVAESSTVVVGPSVAGLLLVFLSPSAVMAVDAVTYAVSGPASTSSARPPWLRAGAAPGPRSAVIWSRAGGSSAHVRGCGASSPCSCSGR